MRSGDEEDSCRSKGRSYEQVKGRWEERFETRYGFWSGTVEHAVYAFLDCGVYGKRLRPCALRQLPS